MRTLVKATMNMDKGNAAIESGEMSGLMGQVMNDLRPEAAYFFPENGKRTAFFVFDMEDSSQLPPVTEPFFRMADAVHVCPVMNGEDLQKGLQQAGH